jgi:hypothetical protein
LPEHATIENAIERLCRQASETAPTAVAGGGIILTNTMGQRRRIVVAVLILCAWLGVLGYRPASRVVAESLPTRLSDRAFWGMITDFSEPNGYFRSDNFLSNERAYQYVIPELKANVADGGVYIGVGPEQNFTYIVALRSKFAFVIDIRRQNAIEHLLYKAFFELSPDRVEFLSRLFARPRPPKLGANTTVESLMAAYEAAPPSMELFDKNLRAAKDRLVGHHRFALSAEDIKSLEYVYTAFYNGGPQLNYTFLGGGSFGSFFPTYSELMTATDGAGTQWSYLASEENYRFVRDLERNNAVVPLVGDFSGPKAIRSVGRYLREHDATVTAFYTSNVEQFLFQGDAWKRYYSSVATLPIDTKSTFIRSIVGRGFQFRNGGPGLPATTTASMTELLKAFREDAIQSYYDVIVMSK